MQLRKNMNNNEGLENTSTENNNTDIDQVIPDLAQLITEVNKMKDDIRENTKEIAKLKAEKESMAKELKENQCKCKNQNLPKKSALDTKISKQKAKEQKDMDQIVTVAEIHATENGDKNEDNNDKKDKKDKDENKAMKEQNETQDKKDKNKWSRTKERMLVVDQ